MRCAPFFFRVGAACYVILLSCGASGGIKHVIGDRLRTLREQKKFSQGKSKSARVCFAAIIMESLVYKRAAGITVISEGFKRNLQGKGVPDKKISL